MLRSHGHGGHETENEVTKHMEQKNHSTGRRKLSPLRIVFYVGAAVAAFIVVCVVAVLLFPGPVANRFIRPRITEAFAKAFPKYSIRVADMSFNIFKSRVGVDSVDLSAVDGSFSTSMGPLSVSGIRWTHLLRGGKITLKDFASAVADAQDIELNFPSSQYVMRCDRLGISVADSEMVVEAMALNPSGNDAQFFAASQVRRARFRLVAPRVQVMGLPCLELLQGKKYRARSAEIHDAFLDILINKDKPFIYDPSSPPLMPNEILASIKGTLQVDSLHVVNGSLKYCERYALHAEPAVLTFDSAQVLVLGIANKGDRDARIIVDAQAKFLKAATMKVSMSVPVMSADCSFKYSGSLSGMDISALNEWLERAEQIRIKKGVLQTASFEITVASGRASGGVRAVYRDLSIAVINKDTGSERGFSDRIASFIARAFKIRGTNVPEESGSLKIGEVKYTRQPDEYFMEFAWFGLRSGIGDVVGF